MNKGYNLAGTLFRDYSGGGARLRNTRSAVAGESLPEGEAVSMSMAFGCFFCTTGKEEYAARRIRDIDPRVRVVVARREKHRSIDGVKTTEMEIIFPGYIFFEAPESLVLRPLFRANALIRALETDDGDWRLQGNDMEFVRWLFARDGLLGVSTAYRENDQIRIISGPMKDLEGMIRRVDRRSKRGLVELDFNGRIFSVWLSFNMVEPGKQEMEIWSDRKQEIPDE